MHPFCTNFYGLDVENNTIKSPNKYKIKTKLLEIFSWSWKNNKDF